MTILTPIPVMRLDDFIEAYGKAPFEYDYGEVIPLIAPQITLSGQSGGWLYRKLADFVDAQQLGEVFIEVPFVLTFEQADWVKGSCTPDVMFYTAQRLADIQSDVNWQLKPLIGAPDFAAEIVSPTDKVVDINHKVLGYLRDGVRLIWLVEPLAKTVTIYTSGSQQFTVMAQLTDILDTEPVIPGFKITLKDLFRV